MSSYIIIKKDVRKASDIINSDIDPLIRRLQSSHIYYLNDTTLVIKLYNNIFTTFLKEDEDNDVRPRFKIYHGNNNKIHNGKTYINKDLMPDQYITMCMVKNGQNNINLICCETTIDSQININFSDVAGSGFLLNGTFFITEGHLALNAYGLSEHRLLYNPIGPYKYNTNTDGRRSPSNPNSDDVGVESVLQSAKYRHPFINGRIKRILEHTLQWAKEVGGMLTIDKKSIINIIKLDTFNKDSLDPQDQCLFGQILVKDGNVIMTEDLFNIVYSIALISDLPLFTKCKICDVAGRILSQRELVHLRLDQIIYIKNLLNNRIYETNYNLTNIFTPYNILLYRAQYGDNFAGVLLPGMSSHGSDLNPRTCVFKDANNNVFFMNIEGRNPLGGIGLDLFQLALICKKMGAVDAINLDGGGSSIMALKEKNNGNTEFIGKKNYTIGNVIKVTPK
jgi:hypothetical protein